MPNQLAETKGISRRGFLKSTAAMGVAVAGGAALAGCSDSKLAPSASTSGEKVLQGTCNGNCLGGCAMNVTVRDGKAVLITRADFPNQDNWQLCQRGQTHLQRLYDPKRVQYPMRRVDGTARGAGEWERVSWEDALSEIATKWKQYQAESGDNSIIFSQGSGNYRPDSSAMQAQLAACMGATMMDTGYDNNGMYTHNDTIGFGLAYIGSDPRDMVNAKNVFVWGNNVTRSYTIRWRWLKRAMEKGAYTVCIDPNFTMVASKCKEFVSIRPGTDGLLAIGMMQVVLENGLQDEAYLIGHTVAPYLVRSDNALYLRSADAVAPVAEGEEGAEAEAAAEAVPAVNAILVWDKATETAVPFEEAADPALEGTFTVNGIEVTTAYSLLLERLQEWDMATIAEYTDIPADKIRELALRFADGPSVCYTAYGPDHYANGFTAYTNMTALCMLTGNLGKPGTGVNGISCPSPMGPSSPVVPPAYAKGVFTVGAQQVPEAIEAGKWADTPFTPRSIYFFNHNMLANMGGRQRWLKALDTLDLIIVADVLMTETAQHADIVLPVQHFFEIEGYATTGSYYVKMNDKCVEPAFEARTDWDLNCDLGRLMGFGDAFTMTHDEFNRLSFENDLAKTLGMSWDKLKSEKLLYGWFADNYIEGQAGFNTATGRGQFYFEGIQPTRTFGMPWDLKRESLPYWEPPYIAWYKSPDFAKYPMTLTTERDKFKTHTQFGFVPELLEIEPEPYVKVNPVDAEARGIKEGDTVKVYNDLGHVTLKAHLHAGARPGIMIMNHGWQEEQFISGHYQDVTSTITGARFNSNSVFENLVQVEKVEG